MKSCSSLPSLMQARGHTLQRNRTRNVASSRCHYDDRGGGHCWRSGLLRVATGLWRTMGLLRAWWLCCKRWEHYYQWLALMLLSLSGCAASWSRFAADEVLVGPYCSMEALQADDGLDVFAMLGQFFMEVSSCFGCLPIICTHGRICDMIFYCLSRIYC
jgi:hypothetical protein